MSTMMRPELSEKNKYWIERHRYYELKHFCMQYPIWKKVSKALEFGGMKNMPLYAEALSKTNALSDPTAECGIAKAFYSKRMDMLEKIALQADSELAEYILKGVTEGVSYDNLKASLEIPCCKDVYYDRYRRFFWLLSKERQ